MTSAIHTIITIDDNDIFAFFFKLNAGVKQFKLLYKIL